MSDSVDTNILVYAIETTGPKSAPALALLRGAEICLSTQVLGEFYRAVTSPRRQVPLSHDEAVAWIQLWKRYDVRPITVSHVDLALELTAQYRVNYYDALILAAASLAGCTLVHSEDISHGQLYGSVRVENPFSP
jgi:predicted nucleic acid-binding protein